MEYAEVKEKSIMLSSGYRMPLVGLGTWQIIQGVQNDAMTSVRQVLTEAFLNASRYGKSDGANGYVPMDITTEINDEESVRTAIEAAVEAGYRHIDTALAYQNEAFIGKALRNLFNQRKVRREDMFIVTKLPANGMRREAVEHFMRKSLSALQLDYVDLYLIHSPVASKRTDNDEDFILVEDGVFMGDHTIDLCETWTAMERLVDKHLVKSIGLSNFNSKQVRRIHQNARIKPAVLQVECHAYLPQKQLHEFCMTLSIALVAYSPLGSPGLPEFAQKYFGIEYHQERLLDDELLKSVARKHKRSPAQVLLRYLIERGVAVIPKSCSPTRIEENIQIFDFSLEKEDICALKSLGGKNLRYFSFDFFKKMKDHPEYPFHALY